MEALCNKGENVPKRRDGFPSPGSAAKGANKNKPFTGSCVKSRESSSGGLCSSDSTEQANAARGSFPLLPPPTRKATVSKCSNSDEKENEPISQLGDKKMPGKLFLNFFLFQLCSV